MVDAFNVFSIGSTSSKRKYSIVVSSRYTRVPHSFSFSKLFTLRGPGTALKKIFRKAIVGKLDLKSLSL